jgi:flagellar biosynthesis/type III secretory pathway protein FliH
MLNAQVEAANREYQAQCRQTHENLSLLLKREYERGYADGLKAATQKKKKKASK